MEGENVGWLKNDVSKSGFWFDKILDEEMENVENVNWEEQHRSSEESAWNTMGIQLGNLAEEDNRCM